jgi:hypothetical protein
LGDEDMMKGKRAVEWEFGHLATLLLVILLFVVLLVIYFTMSGKGKEMLDGIANMLRFGG